MRSSAFKHYQRGARTLTAEEAFSGGIQYTNAALGEGFFKALVNYDFKDNGSVLIPRGGYRVIPAQIHTLKSGLFKLNTHHIGQASVKISDFEDALHRYILFMRDATENTAYNWDEMQLLVEDSIINGVPILVPALLQKEAAGTYMIPSKVNTAFYQIHGMQFNTPRSTPIHATLNGVTYFPIEYTDAEDVKTTGIGALKISKGQVEDEDDTNDYTATISKLVPKEITPNEAVNYGYNMLHPTPYSFVDQLSAAVAENYILTNGVLPYKDKLCTQLMFNGKPGGAVTFRLLASFPDETSTYKVKWEIRDLESDTTVVYQTIEGSPIYHYDDTDKCAKDAAGNKYITLSFTPPYKEFAIIATVYSTTDLTEPLQVMTLASYHLTADTPGSTANIEVKTYDLSKPKGMCVWAQRLVLWGTSPILFISDPNDPTYFPYPQGTEIFDEAVITATPYLSDLLVFTESKLYKLTWAADGLSYTKTVIQDKLMLSEFDAVTVTVVKNMVFFKNGNYFYMIVPSSNETKGELTLAPISRQITNLLDNFETEVLDIIMTMYNPQRFILPMPNEKYKLEVLQYHNYMDNNAMRSVYKLQLNIAEANGGIRTTETIFDFTLNYDTMLRVWSMYIIESNATKMLPYRQTVTDTTIFVNLCHVETYDDDTESSTYQQVIPVPKLELVKVNPLEKKDDFTLDIGLLQGVRRFRNWQFIDTGYRNHDQHTKKRYREIQFKLNNISQLSLEFGTEFMIDDDLRKNLFKYSVSQIDEEPTSPYFGWIYVDREFNDPVAAMGATMLDEEEPDEEFQPFPPSPVLTSGDVLYSNKWVLGYSPLARVALTKVRFPVSGKGYCPRLKLLSFNEQQYELLTLGFVYRMMFVR